MVRHRVLVAMTLSAVVASACTPGPTYRTPAVVVPPAFKEVGNPDAAMWNASQPRDDVDRGRWWTRFADPQLNELEDKLNISNQNVAVAVAALLASRAIIREARALFFPTIQAGVSVTNTRISTIFGSGQQTMFMLYDLSLSAVWEPDLFGRVRNSVRVAQFGAQVSAADLANVRLSAQADLAAIYFQLRATDALIQVFDSTVSAYEEAYVLNRDLYQAGLTSDEAVSQAEAQWKAAQALAANTRIVRAQYEHAIAVLIGEPPSTFSLAAEALTATPPPIPVGVPSELLERRPDVASAERAVARANAQIGLAEAAYFPRLLLNPTGGFESPSIAHWLTWPARYWTIGPVLLQTVFDGGLRRATVQQFKAEYEQTVANYRQTVLTAFQQVEDNLAALRILSDVIVEQTAAVDAARRNLDVATVRYQAGLESYLNVVVAQNLVLEYEQTYVTFRMQQMVASVQLIKALGGGWELSDLPSRDSLTARP